MKLETYRFVQFFGGLFLAVLCASIVMLHRSRRPLVAWLSLTSIPVLITGMFILLYLDPRP